MRRLKFQDNSGQFLKKQENPGHSRTFQDIAEIRRTFQDISGSWTPCYYTDVILFSDFIRDKTPYLSALMRSMLVKKMDKKDLKILSPEMANILSNFEGWGPTEVAYKKRSV